MRPARVKTSFPTYDYEKWQTAGDDWVFHTPYHGELVHIEHYINPSRVLARFPTGDFLEVSTRNLKLLKFKLRAHNE